MENKLENHSTRAPLEAWISWRDANFDKEIENWRRFVEYWMDNYSPINRLVVSYEKITDDIMGAVEATRIAEFLSRSKGVVTCPPELIACVWHKVVKYKENSSSNNEGRRLQEIPEIPAPPTKEELAKYGIDPSQFALSDPTNPNSHRSGPTYTPPYTKQQLKDLLSTLTALLERYREEKSLAPILVGYIDAVEKRGES
mmetsp:Transcript_21721/g.32245  ORF Transcript_21721/g.32245 Transcript_21721/m.32245 type:complete len:199 (+) Transcript_21721:112-708(+)